MCLAFPGRVIKIQGLKATIKYPQSEAFALISEEHVQVGDFVMVQMGIVTKIVTQAEAISSQQAWQEALSINPKS